MDIPDSWKAALAAVQTICPEAVIGGGCLRDLDNGREVKDIDIFVSGRGLNELVGVHGRLAAVGFEPEDIDTDKLYPVGDGNDVVGHFEAEFDGVSVPVQIIMVNFNCARICDRFDFGICRIAFDGTTLTRTDEYEADKRYQVFKLRRRREGVEMVASVHRFARLSRKYDGWTFALYEDDDPFGFSAAA